jgi:hypothetical protein
MVSIHTWGKIAAVGKRNAVKEEEILGKKERKKGGRRK